MWEKMPRWGKTDGRREVDGLKRARMASVAFLAVMAVVPLWLLVSGVWWKIGLPTWQSLCDGSYLAGAQEACRQGIPGSGQFATWVAHARYLTGEREIDGYFLSEDSIMKDMQSPDVQTVQRNNAVLAQLAASIDGPKTYLTLIPTAAAIKQNELPQLVEVYNQRSFIETVYEQIGGMAKTVDVYQPLFVNMDKYLYYRTQENLTALGGYYVYSAMCERLGHTLRTPDYYTIEYLTHSFEGQSKQQFPFVPVKDDILTIYDYTRYERSYRVTHEWEDGSTAIYSRLYLREAADSEQPMDVYMGPESPRTDIEVDGVAYELRLLVLGDHTAKSYLPLLANHYVQVTFLDVRQATKEFYAEVDPERYDQVLVALSADTYAHTDLSAARELVREREKEA